MSLESTEFGFTFNSSEAKEGLAAFVEKRAPNFKAESITMEDALTLMI